MFRSVGARGAIPPGDPTGGGRGSEQPTHYHNLSRLPQLPGLKSVLVKDVARAAGIDPHPGRGVLRIRSVGRSHAFGRELDTGQVEVIGDDGAVDLPLGKPALIAGALFDQRARSTRGSRDLQAQATVLVLDLVDVVTHVEEFPQLVCATVAVEDVKRFPVLGRIAGNVQALGRGGEDERWENLVERRGLGDHFRSCGSNSRGLCGYPHSCDKGGHY
jgi:hypothetical protein